MRWSKDHTYCIGTDADSFSNLSEVTILDRRAYKSVEEAVTALNSGVLLCSEYCVVYSMRRQAFYMLWPKEKTEADASRFAATVKQRATAMGGRTPPLSTQAPAPVTRSTAPTSAAALMPTVYRPDMSTNTLQRGSAPSIQQAHVAKGKDLLRLDKIHYQSSGQNANSEVSTTDTTPAGTTPNTDRDSTPVRPKFMSGQTPPSTSATTDTAAYSSGITRKSSYPSISIRQNSVTAASQAPPAGFPPGFARTLTPTRIVQRRSVSPTARANGLPPMLLSPRKIQALQAKNGVEEEKLAEQKLPNREGEATPVVPPVVPWLGLHSEEESDALRLLREKAFREQDSEASRQLRELAFREQADIYRLEQQLQQEDAKNAAKATLQRAFVEENTERQLRETTLREQAIAVEGKIQEICGAMGIDIKVDKVNEDMMLDLEMTQPAGITESVRKETSKDTRPSLGAPRQRERDPRGTRTASSKAPPGNPSLGAPRASSYTPVPAEQELHVDTDVFEPHRVRKRPTSVSRQQSSSASPKKETSAKVTASPGKGALSSRQASPSRPRAVAQAPKPTPNALAQQQPQLSAPVPVVQPQVEQPTQVPVVIEQQVALADVTTMTVEELQMDQDSFDPLYPPMRSVLLDRLGLPQTMTIESLLDNPGSFNDGVWMVLDGFTTGLVLKLVPHSRSHPSRATDAEKFINLQRRCPKLVTEFSLAFPLRIFQLKSPRGTRCKDLIVMRRAHGLQLTQHLYHKFHSGQYPQLLEIFKELGTFLAVLHRVYKGMQHGDCQPSNVFYDELSGNFTLIDVADFGYGPYVAEGGENDVEHFGDGLKTLTQFYGDNFIVDLIRHFKAAYLEEKNRRR